MSELPPRISDGDKEQIAWPLVRLDLNKPMNIDSGIIGATPLVSVIMNCYNGEQYLQNAISSVIRQTYENWEIVFIDNASTDGSSEIAKSFGDYLRYYRTECTVPLYKARNIALDKSNGEVIAFLDCDDIWIDNKLELQIKAYLNGAKIVGGGYQTIDGSGNFIRSKKVVYANSHITDKLLRGKVMISIGTILIDAKLLKEYRFDHHYNLAGDFELWLRLSLKHDFYFVDEVVELSRLHQKNLSIILKESWLQERRDIYINFLKRHSVLSHPSILLWLVRSELMGVRSLIGRFKDRYLRRI